MSDSAPPAATPPPDPKPDWKMRFPKWVGITIGFIIAGMTGIQLLEGYTLPACDSKRSLDGLRSIFKDKDLPEPTLTGAKSVTSSFSEKTCEANYEIPEENGTLDYRVFWDGWDPKVMITKVNQ